MLQGKAIRMLAKSLAESGDLIRQSTSSKKDALKRMTLALDHGGDPAFENLAIVVGAMKAGTTTIYKHLQQHPRIAGNQFAKEPDFFCSRPHEGKENFRKGLCWYAAQWDFQPEKHVWALEASTSYTKFPLFQGSFRRMAELSFHYRFIYILRDPVDRVESHIKDSIIQRRFELDNFSLNRPSLIFPSRYAFQLDQILAHFDRGHVLLLGFSDLTLRPADTLQRIESFLGLRPHDYGPITPKNSSRTLRVDGEQWQLAADEKKRVADQVADDVDRLGRVYGFETRHHFRTFFSLTG
jgi:Sulfotransferase family